MAMTQHQEQAVPASRRSVPLLEVRNLAVEFPTGRGWTRVVEDVTFSIGAGETLGLVGESGSGKSVTSLAVLGLVGAQGGRIASGSVVFEGVDLVSAPASHLRQVRGRGIGMVFQQALRSLNPAFRVGDQIAETIRRHEPVSRRVAEQRAVELLQRVHIPDGARRARNYPHEFSGGMCQRAMIAMAIACHPRLLIADEPTTALDVTVQARILDLLRELQADTGVSILFISHDLAVIAEMCSRVVVMYAGQVVENASSKELFRRPMHPYTQGLLDSIPRRGQHRLEAIPGTVPPVGAMPTGCRFHTRCPHSVAGRCDADGVVLVDLGGERATRCVRHAELELPGMHR